MLFCMPLLAKQLLTSKVKPYTTFSVFLYSSMAVALAEIYQRSHPVLLTGCLWYYATSKSSLLTESAWLAKQCWKVSTKDCVICSTAPSHLVESPSWCLAIFCKLLQCIQCRSTRQRLPIKTALLLCLVLESGICFQFID